MLSAASDWATTDKLYELKATSGTGKSRSWLINPDGEMSRDIAIDGEWAAAGTEYKLSFTDKPDVAIAYADADCSDDGVSLAFTARFEGFAPGD